jgi:hypothetical protein
MKFSVVLTLALIASPSLAPAGTDVFLKALAFALTGNDGAEIGIKDRENCVFRLVGHSNHGDGNTPSEEVFHLNNVDLDRIKFQEYASKLTSGVTTKYVEVSLFGEDTVYEDRAIYVWKDLNTSTGPTKSTNETLVIYTDEYARLVRAWTYIYSHGCKGKKSSF